MKKIRNVIAAFFVTIVGLALSACAGSNNAVRNNSIYAAGQTGGGGQVVSTAPSLDTDFQGNPCVKGTGIFESTSKAEIAKNPRLRLITDGSYAGRQVIMEYGVRKGSIHNEFYTLTKDDQIWVDEKGVPAYRADCANRLGEIKTPVVATASIPQGNVQPPGIFQDNHQDNHTSVHFHVEFSPHIVLATSGAGYGSDYNTGCAPSYNNYGNYRPVCRVAQIRPNYCQQPVQQYCRQPVYNNCPVPVQQYCPPPVTQYCPPPSPDQSLNGRGGGVYNQFGARVR